MNKKIVGWRTPYREVEGAEIEYAFDGVEDGLEYHRERVLSCDLFWVGESEALTLATPLHAQVQPAEQADCPHAAPFRYCDGCKVSPCPVGLDKPTVAALAEKAVNEVLDNPRRPSREWYATKIAETEGLDSALPSGGLVQPAEQVGEDCPACGSDDCKIIKAFHCNACKGDYFQTFGKADSRDIPAQQQPGNTEGVTSADRTPADFAAWLLGKHPHSFINQKNMADFLAEYNDECAALTPPQAPGKEG